MTCTSKSLQYNVPNHDIEDIMKKYNPNHNESLENEEVAMKYLCSLNSKVIKLVNELKEKNENDRMILNKLKNNFVKFITQVNRVHKNQFKKTILLYYYRKFLENGKIEENKYLEIMLMKSPSRDISGINQITILTSPHPGDQDFSCKHDCFYCPNEPAHEGNNWTAQPRSYLYSEPAVQRANRNKFDAFSQTIDRMSSLLMCGHKCDKLEFILEGGTFTEYPKPYLKKYFRDFIYACNVFYDTLKTNKNLREPLTLEEEILINETAHCKIIGICIETRPDAILENDEDNIPWLDTLLCWGVTRLQLGMQHIDNFILKKINRGHSVEKAIKAIEICKNNCFKIDIHIMPDLPHSSPEKDKNMFDQLYNTSLYQPDQMKIYPCEVVPWTKIKTWYENGTYKPYGNDKAKIQEVLQYAMVKCPPWVRIPRVVRDIPHQYISGGLKCGNMRQNIENDFNFKGADIRFREIGRHPSYGLEDACLVIRKYDASNGIDYFISMESTDKKALFGFCRLRIPSSNYENQIAYPETLKNRGLIRELHVYGSLVGVLNNKSNANSMQHSGIGRRLIKTAEDISYYNHYKGGTVVISGIGVRNYYRKLGYFYENNYMVKTFDYFQTYMLFCVLSMFIVSGFYILLM